MDYQLLHEDENSYRLKHPEGHEIVIAKKAISDALHSKIKSFYKGGEAKSEASDDESESIDNPFKDLSAEADPVATPVPQDMAQTPVPQATPSPMPTPTPEQMAQPPQVGGPAPVPTGTPPPVDQSQVPIGGEAVPQGQASGRGAAGGMQNPRMDVLSQMEAIGKQEQQAIQGKAGAESEMYKSQAKLAAANQIEQEQAYNNHVAIMARQERELGQISDSIMNQKIDPNRLWHEASMGGKVAASIGLILGGIGAGLTGGPNQAADMLDKMVSRDIDAQKADLGKKQTLYSMNMQRLHNENAAYMATKLQLASVYQGQLAQATARAQSSIAKQNGQLMSATIQQQLIPLKAEMAKWQMGQQLLYGQGGPGGNEARQAQAENMLFDDKTRERIVHVPTPNGLRPVLAPDKEAADKFRQTEEVNQDLTSKIDNAINFMDKHGTLVNPFSEAKGQAKIIRDSLIAAGGKLHDLNRMNDNEFAMYQDMVPNLGQLNTSQGIAQLKALKNVVQDKRNALYQQMTPGYNPGKFKSLEGAPVK